MRQIMNRKNWMLFIAIVGSLCGSNAVVANPPPGPDYVCVRNFAPNSKTSELPDLFVFVKPADRGNGQIYTKRYDASYCETAPASFKWVQGTSGEKICACEFHQERIAEYCYSNPKIFSWALKADVD